MEIIDNRNNTKLKFEDLAPGEVFEYESDIMMKIETIDNGAEILNAVFVECGEATFVDDYSSVARLNCTLSIK